MLDPHEVDDILERFRDWLTTAGEDLGADDVVALAEQLRDGRGLSPVDGSVGLLQMAEAVTALRHDVKLQSKGVRSLRETTETALEGLHRATEEVEASRQDADAAAEQAVRPLVDKLIKLDELIRQAALSAKGLRPSREAAPPLLPTEKLLAELERRFAALPRWRRLAAAAWHGTVCEIVRGHQPSAQATENTAGDAVASLVEGIRMLEARSESLLAEAGVERIVCLGQRVDPAKMRVVAVADADAQPAGTVVEEIRPGYTCRGEVVRPAEVRATRETRPTPSETSDAAEASDTPLPDPEAPDDREDPDA